ncbi:MAG: histidinol-phosphatase HisJ family protein [Butyrivibrio sp.]|nr:histidinol-phosphatase HisJ family protein [Butyrivibrio sp.]
MGLPSDFHLHSEHSEDSTAPMKSMIEKGIELGLLSMCFTEHMDIDYPECPDLPAGSFILNTDSYRRDFLANKEIYKDRIDLHFGVELGLQPHIVSENINFIEKNDFEFIIASTHIINHTDPYYPEFWKDKSDKKVFEEYFKESLTNIKLFKNYDVYGHLDYVVRYAPEKDANYSVADYRDLLDELLKTIIYDGKGLDLNTKALYSGMKEPNPCRSILKRYKELGGEIITIGSDAHKPSDLAGRFDLISDLATECGFDYYCTFADRKAAYHKF